MKRFARSASVGGRKGQLLRCGLVRVSYKAAGGLEGAQPASDGAFRVPAGGRSLLHPARAGRGVLVMAVRDIIVFAPRPWGGERGATSWDVVLETKLVSGHAKQTSC